MIPLVYVPNPKIALRKLLAGTIEVSFCPQQAINLVSSKVINVELNVTGESGLIVGETPIGLVNGSNATFQTAFDFTPESVEVFIETARLSLLDDYNTAGNRTINFYVSPLTGEKIRVNYKKS